MLHSQNKITAVVLAGGKGTRLKPYTTVIPKPLMPVDDRPVLEYVLSWIKQGGVSTVIIAINHLAELIMAVIGSGEKWGLDIRYSREEKPLSTIGPLTLIESLPENFLVLNGDILTDLKVDDFFRFHLEKGALLTVATFERISKIDFGVIEIDEQGKVNNFLEKPEYSSRVSMGIYAMNRRILDYIPRNKAFGFDELVLALLREKEDIAVFTHDGKWLDIGRPEDYDLANQEDTAPLLKRMLGVG